MLTLRTIPLKDKSPAQQLMKRMLHTILPNIKHKIMKKCQADNIKRNVLQTLKGNDTVRLRSHENLKNLVLI